MESWTLFSYLEERYDLSRCLYFINFSLLHIRIPALSMQLQYPTRQLYYDGKPQHSLLSGDTFQTIDPSTGNPLADVVSASNADIDAAVSSASNAFPAWSRLPAIERSRILHRAASLLRSRNDELAEVETRDTGKPYSETSVVDIVTGADVLEYYANLVGGGGLVGERTQLKEGAWSMSTKEPLGVCAGIGAWNYPIQMYVSSLPRLRCCAVQS